MPCPYFDLTGVSFRVIGATLKASLDRIATRKAGLCTFAHLRLYAVPRMFMVREVRMAHKVQNSKQLANPARSKNACCAVLAVLIRGKTMRLRVKSGRGEGGEGGGDLGGPPSMESRWRMQGNCPCLSPSVFRATEAGKQTMTKLQCRWSCMGTNRKSRLKMSLPCNRNYRSAPQGFRDELL